MNREQLFQEKLTLKIWDQYFNRVNRLAKTLSESQKKELRLEIQDHLYASFKEEQGQTEAERLMNAIEKIGEPEEYIKPLIADILLSDASRSLNPKNIFKGLYHYVYGGISKFFIGLVYTLGYFFVILFGLMGLLKTFFPNNIGWFIHESGAVTLGISAKNKFNVGIVGDSTPIVNEILGYWVIPIGLICSCVLFLILTKRLKSLKGTKMIKKN
jgi:uncharacterized membrane protein